LEAVSGRANNTMPDNTATLEENIATARAYMKSEAAANTRKMYAELNMDKDFVERAIIQKACRGLDSAQISAIRARLHEPLVAQAVAPLLSTESSPVVEPVSAEPSPVGSAFVAELWERVATRDRGELIEEEEYLMKTLSGKRYTAKELSVQFDCDVDTIRNHAKKLFGDLTEMKSVKSGAHRPAATFDEAQVTMLLGSIKSPVSSGAKANMANNLQGTETEMTLDMEIALAEQKSKELWKRKAKQNEARAVKAEAALGRLSMEHHDTLNANTMLFRIAESAGALTSNREDKLALYRRR
jgi:hypothetical protein